MAKKQNSKAVYDLEEKTFQFANAVRLFVKTLPKNDVNRKEGRQLVRVSGSVGANYIEGNESLEKKDFLMTSIQRIRYVSFLVIEIWDLFFVICDTSKLALPALKSKTPVLLQGVIHASHSQ